jgi:hypothetical protein
MNPTTLSLIERPYQDVVDDILVSLVGGVVNEPIFFDVKSDSYPLAESARAVRGITGSVTELRDGVTVRIAHSFQQGIDFVFDPDLNLVVWQEGATLPADETLFFVDYFRLNQDSPITDINVGSVVRTLSEAVGREIATVYEQVNRAYLFGFIDTAEGTALDLVVSILGVTRKTTDFAVGLATLFRDPAVAGDVTIPSGIVLTTAAGEVSFETTEQRTLQRGQARIDVPVRAGAEFPGEDGRVEANAITQLDRPIAGIARVTNFEATFLGAEPETDAQLRARAKAALRAFGKATLAAIEKAVRDGFAKTLEIFDPNAAPARRSAPGTATLLIEAEPERFPGLVDAVNQVRAGGVRVGLVARYVFFTPKLVVGIASGLTSAGKQKVVDDVIAAVEAYVQPLTSGDPALGADLLDAVKAVADVNEATVVDVVVARSEASPVAAEGLVDALVEFIQGTPPAEEAELRTALDELLFKQDVAVPGADRVPDRSLLLKADGSGPASDADIEAGDFQVASVVDGESWWVVADMKAADVALTEDVA